MAREALATHKNKITFFFIYRPAPCMSPPTQRRAGKSPCIVPQYGKHYMSPGYNGRLQTPAACHPAEGEVFHSGGPRNKSKRLHQIIAFGFPPFMFMKCLSHKKRNFRVVSVRSSISRVTRLWSGGPRFDSHQEQRSDVLYHRVQTSSEVHPIFYPVDTGS